MTTHPFGFDHIGLGMLDEASIRHIMADGADAWSADYPDAAGRPYLHVMVRGGRTLIEEYGVGRVLAARTEEATMTRAIGVHGSDAVNDNGGGDDVPEGASRFWWRAAGGACSIWTPMTCPVRFSFVPSVGLATVHVPIPVGSPWVAPEPGPIARRLGRPFVEADGSPRPGILGRLPAAGSRPTRQPITLHTITVPGILLAELAEALEASLGPTASIEWRPFAWVADGSFRRQVWPASVGHARPDMVEFSIGLAGSRSPWPKGRPVFGNAGPEGPGRRIPDRRASSLS